MAHLKVSELLTYWNLPQLCQKFQAEEIGIDALHYLTEQDISELIPKIGPRAIFRAALQEWKQQHQQQQQQQQTTHNGSPYEDPLIQSPLGVHLDKQEVDHTAQDLMPLPKLVKQETEMEDVETEKHNPLTIVGWVSQQAIAESIEFVDGPTSVVEVLPQEVVEVSQDEENDQVLDITDTSEDMEILNVRDILLKSVEGRKALKFHKVHKTLDKVNRRRIVKVIISLLLERKLRISPAQFTNLAEQIVQQFPREKLATYYVPRMGLICPRGSLYNKYLNMCRYLRRKGLLDYQIQSRCRRTTQYNKNKSRPRTHS